MFLLIKTAKKAICGSIFKKTLREIISVTLGRSILIKNHTKGSCMKLFKSSMVWALVALVCVAQNASAGRFVVLNNPIAKISATQDIFCFSPDVHLKKTSSIASPAKGQIVVDPTDSSVVVFDGKEWQSANGYVIDVPSVTTITDLKELAYNQGWTSQIAFATLWVDVFTPERLATQKGCRTSLLEERAKFIMNRVSEFERQGAETVEDWEKRSNALWSSDIRPAMFEIYEEIEALPEDERSESLKKAFESAKQLLFYRPSEVDEPSEADPASADDKKDTKSNSLQERFMSINAGYRYAGANVVILVIASMLQAMQDGYCGVGIEAKDIAQLSMKKKAVRALAAVVSLKKHASNVSAFYRVFRPVSEKGVVSPKFLARVTQFAKNKPFIVAGLLGVTALNTYGVYSHAGDIKTYAGEMGTKVKGLVIKKTA